ncbi:WAT1-related protein At5g40230-like [Coffea eugenioides]|uniref:WAT1-related protein At5g40230-like n=1 Tax=Coffea eugenioides TaxID=49369 RepID=UPI000F608077|nr:WAT1-related protein At5g40230-like [Coffea eugenioides]
MGVKSYVVQMVPLTAMAIVECYRRWLIHTEQSSHVRRNESLCLCCLLKCYCHFILSPFSFIFERKNRPHLNLSLLCKFFLLSLLGSPTLGSATTNLIPAFTFLLAVIFRMEKLNLRSSRSQIKMIGTLVSIAGALVLTLYKGPSIGSFATNSLSPPSESSHRPLNSSSYLLEVRNNWVIGGFFFATACLSVSFWNISQAALLKGYPSQLTTAAVYCLFASIQGAGVSLIAERNNPKSLETKARY